MKEKDPYLDELDALNEDVPEEPGEDDEPTRVDFPAEQPPVSPSSKEMMGLSPDIPVQVVVVMGKKSVTVKDLLGLRMGQVIDMEKLPTEPVDIVAQGKVIAKGELVEVDGKLGVRILRILK